MRILPEDYKQHLWKQWDWKESYRCGSFTQLFLLWYQFNFNEYFAAPEAQEILWKTKNDLIIRLFGRTAPNIRYFA